MKQIWLNVGVVLMLIMLLICIRGLWLLGQRPQSYGLEYIFVFGIIISLLYLIGFGIYKYYNVEHNK